MVFAFIRPFVVLLRGDFEVVLFILIGLVWLIANLVKKASAASRGATPQQRPKPRIEPQGEAEIEPQVPSLSEFLRRLQEISGEEVKPRAPRQPEARQPRQGTIVPTPKPPHAKKVTPRPVPASQPGLKRVRVPEPPPGPELAPGIALPVGELYEREPRPSPVVMPSPPKGPEIDAYVIRAPAPRRITAFLGAPVSASEVRKGIVLAEILGRPKALRGRRRLPRRR